MLPFIACKSNDDNFIAISHDYLPWIETKHKVLIENKKN